MDYLLLEDKTIDYLSFKEFQALNETFMNLLPSHIEKKKEHAKEVFDLIQKSYEDQGGIHGNGFKSPEDMIHNIPMWKIHKKDGKIRSVAMYKEAEGRKRVAIGTDGTEEGKKSATEVVTADLKRSRAHMEVSGKSLSFLKKHVNLKDHLHSFDSAQKFHTSRGDKITKPKEDDPEVVRHPEFKEYFYSRDIGGKPHTKLMIGAQGKHIVEATVYNKSEEIERGKTSALSPDHFKKGDWTFKPMIHTPSQAMERRPEFTEEHWHELHDKVHAVLTDRTNQVSDHKFPAKVKNGEAVFYSRKQQQGYIGNVDHIKKELRIVTVLPKTQSRAVKPSDQRIVLDSVQNNDYPLVYLD